MHTGNNADDGVSILKRLLKKTLIVASVEGVALSLATFVDTQQIAWLFKPVMMISIILCLIVLLLILPLVTVIEGMTLFSNTQQRRLLLYTLALCGLQFLLGFFQLAQLLSSLRY